MGVQRVIEFEAVSEEGAGRVERAVAAAFAALEKERPDGVRLAYWRVPGGRRFLALIELAEEDRNPLMGIEAARRLPEVIAECVEGGYPRPQVVECVGEYGFGL
ncbi:MULTISPECIES: hypothetical protein [Thermomonospora]|uniref:Uncharacterized protein n=1 Tax=Thermomonospora curvata (strain ATCC 19995 / DSM 43183 / JCM 3096 / KCTC 9072 / NBRC 15933 / NCIMB 10081 / Henssen B9) TaxID=471852 RepID=D1A7A0_THECD|nr:MULTISPECIES: hypothetical protein [Thermomonospora]ACZ00306.1 conserved hypothetical protein [Thermomonospora curvata DSM 43183]PKK12105.1 MAG: hypothetical protein BUE48_023480 [Thermomonospora sp. CIF 1]